MSQVLLDLEMGSKASNIINFLPQQNIFLKFTMLSSFFSFESWLEKNKTKQKPKIFITIVNSFNIWKNLRFREYSFTDIVQPTGDRDTTHILWQGAPGQPTVQCRLLPSSPSRGKDTDLEWYHAGALLAEGENFLVSVI